MAFSVKAFSSAAFSAALDNLTKDRPDFKVLGWMLGPERFLEYAHSIGLENWQLRDAAPPVAPAALRDIVAAKEEPIFLWSGIVDASMFMALFEKHGALKDGAAVFDFGCGCGRLTRYLGVADQYRTFASDINPKLVDWCRSNLTVDTRLNGARPPLPFDDAQFDCGYSLSIFTHLPEHLAKAWLAELARVTKPGGLLAFTTHGFPSLAVIKNSTQHHMMFNLTAERAGEIEKSIAAGDFVYLPYGSAVLNLAEAGDEYGNCFVSEDRIRREWLEDQWSLIEFVSGGLRAWQDVVVIRRR